MTALETCREAGLILDRAAELATALEALAADPGDEELITRALQKTGRVRARADFLAMHLSRRLFGREEIDT